ncbi:tyrosine-type recombinase/integrase [Nocardioides terrisoli]|uniref:tyrosine-type recombinase/integrase n=1 Tax=Nocardioides terrisoli TaxID=3388267 RepID=UPI00287B5C44|nr:tyrosine-type recombinase/integrase [Nocardioides marmorisolisilvae]
MSGNVSRRPSGEWEYRFEVGPDPLTGRRRRMTKSGFPTKRAAAQAMNKAINAHLQGRSVKNSRRTVEDFLDEWHAAVRGAIRPSTWVNYRNYLDAYVIPVIGQTALQDLTAVRLNLLYTHLLQRGRVKTSGGLAPKTVQNVHRMLHRALRDAVKWDQLPRNYAEDAEPPRAPRPRPTIWTPEQLGQFVRHVESDRFYALWLLVATTGLRRGELAGLLRHDVDLHLRRVSPSTPRVVVAGRAVESQPKTASGVRNLALDPDTCEALREYFITWDTERELLGQDTQLLFVWADGRPLHPDTITALFHGHCKSAGLPRIRLHDVRHSYASAALKAGIPAKVISERLGHSTAAFTLQTYTHVIPGMDAVAADAVAQLILAPAPTEIGEVDGSILGSIDDSKGDQKSEEPADLQQNRRSAGPSQSSGGRI